MSQMMTGSGKKPATPVGAVVIRFAGDSGDGMQFAGGEFASTSAIVGNDIATFPDFPAEIRAPRGTTFGVSGFQLQFSSSDIHTPGDVVNVLMAMNPAALKVNLHEVEEGGIVIADSDEFTPANLSKCGYPPGYDPLADETLNAKYRIFRVPMSRLTREALAGVEIGTKDMDRCRNMFALGIAYWLYQRPIDSTVNRFNAYYGGAKKRPELAAANTMVLKAGYYFGDTAELFPMRYEVAPAPKIPGTYRRISGNHAIVLALATVAAKARKDVVFAGYPITPASEILHGLARLKHLGVRTFQAEDEIAAMCAAIGASYAGQLGVTATSGPGLALKSEGLGLAVIYELPLVVIDVQRAGPSTGMPTKTEQADLLQAMFGRPGECPCIVLAPGTPAECFDMTIEAARLAIRHMTPVVLLSDAYIANGTEPWKIPSLDAITEIPVSHPGVEAKTNGVFQPYARDEHTLARPWALPGTPGLEHRIGSLEKQQLTGNVSYDPANHEAMVKLRQEKIDRAAATIPPLQVRGDDSGDVLILGWGSTYGAITTAGDRLREEGRRVSTAHLRYLNPMPGNLEQVLRRFKQVIIPENNLGQLRMIIRARFLTDAKGINHVRGRAFRVDSIVHEVREMMNKQG
ncbi:MAG: 2-oxoacid:acceptor oxidoreductase subunit alpha [Leptolyngbya sp. PLA3]|nr:MAG: 2-oxoacid:acceptor oxidoreductase subunit alpha [Cyanobacteria bacterium CYA]MCE7967842.1 2-oxoacid:acceptor oxidoreductase subunit alpha [Leptolyngbya sp. PL-A3]